MNSTLVDCIAGQTMWLECSDGSEFGGKRTEGLNRLLLVMFCRCDLQSFLLIKLASVPFSDFSVCLFEYTASV